ncbi:lipase family protein [Corynebacterium lipophiloflavum]|uniref:Secretory lipase n=1 Tax=Corynebacterium lipophiloflavum (strain ATCC 700352 / DSM 44291 / CCUG 37336 / JCM 10383 / DMMZ 1944) TaxID=525263 RepID=C0XT41_CORLD|nr:lipase family protein [Corynebacterium lipophiloflavum]EEI16580.1 secretory lipase [Corynebacterium lipophiloflavum DSM 44291]
MIAQLARALAPFVVDAVNLNPRTDPEFGQATWVSGMTPGTLLNAVEISPVGLGTRLNDASAWRIDYTTSDSGQRILTATGAVYRSRVPWAKNTPRPTIAFAPSTQGVAPRCDPSYSCTVGVGLRTRPFDVIAAHEQPVINFMLALGCNVVLTDYPRHPEGNVQLYCDHASGARALADAVRASTSLGVGIDNLGLWGFSQGGGAIGAWLEQPEYAPELQPLAAVVGSPPADLAEVLKHIDGAMPAAVILYAVAGMLAADPESFADLTPELTDEGLAAIAFGSQVCGPGAVLKYRYTRTEKWTASGLPLAELLDRNPASSEFLDRMALGNRKPARIPVRLWGSKNDDVIPFSGSERLAEKWGVQLHNHRWPKIPGRMGLNHFMPYFANAPRDVKWLLRQLGG